MILVVCHLRGFRIYLLVTLSFSRGVKECLPGSSLGLTWAAGLLRLISYFLPQRGSRKLSPSIRQPMCAQNQNSCPLSSLFRTRSICWSSKGPCPPNAPSSLFIVVVAENGVSPACSSDAIAFGFNSHGTDETWCIDTRGVLTLSVESGTYQRLGLLGTPLPWKLHRNRYSMPIPLPYMPFPY